jgi:hypothetical protein
MHRRLDLALWGIEVEVAWDPLVSMPVLDSSDAFGFACVVCGWGDFRNRGFAGTVPVPDTTFADLLVGVRLVSDPPGTSQDYTTLLGGTSPPNPVAAVATRLLLHKVRENEGRHVPRSSILRPAAFVSPLYQYTRSTGRRYSSAHRLVPSDWT